MKLPSETVLNEREIRFLLDGHGHDGKDSAYINRNISSNSTGSSTSNHTTVSGGTIRGATVVIAASNASAASKAGADFVCTGTNDGTAINNFILGGSLAPASIVFTEGTFNLDTFIFVLDKTSAYGEGWATIFHILPGNSVNPGGFQVGAGAILKNFSINIDPGNNHLEGYLIHQSTISSSYTIDNIYVYGGGGVARIIVDTNKDLNMFNCVFNMDPPPDPFIAGSIIALTNTNATDNGIININNNIFINCELTFGNPIYNYLIIVNNNYFTGTPGADTIVTFAKNNIIIDNNIFSNCNQQSQLMTITSDWAKISNNIFNSCLRISMSNRLSGLFINNQYQNTIDTQLVLFLDEGNHMVQGNLFDGGTPRNAVYAFNGQNVVINNRFGPTAFGIGPAIFHNSGTLLLNLDGSSNNWNYGV